MIPAQGVLIVLPEGARQEQAPEAELLISYLRQAGFPVRAEIVGEDHPSPDAGVTYWHIPDRRQYRAAARRIERRQPTGRVLAGGAFATEYDLLILRDLEGIDAIVRGEPEETLLAVVQRRDAAWLREPGLSVRAGDGRPVRNPPRALSENLDHLPVPALDFAPARRGPRYRQRILLSRGCNGNCAYCGSQVPYRAEYAPRTEFWRSRSADAIVDEIQFFHDRLRVSRFAFRSHSLFGHHPTHAAVIREVAEQLRARHLDIDFVFVARAGALYRNRDLLAPLRRAGLSSVTLGIDSGLETRLQTYGVGFGRAEIIGALRVLHQSEIPFRPAFIFYDPYLTLAEIEENLEFLRQIAKYFDHLPRPYSYYLDHHLLNTTLTVTPTMPIYVPLRKEGLADLADPLTEDPGIRFRDPEAGRFFQLHRRCNRSIMARLQSLFSPGTKASGEHCFALDLLRETANALHDAPTAAEDVLFARLRDWTVDRLRPDWPELIGPLTA
jgi:hypothetical protein